MQDNKRDIKVLELIDTYYPTVDGAIGAVKEYCKNIVKFADCKLAVPKADKKSKYIDQEDFEVIRCAATSAPEGYRYAFPEQDAKFVKRIREEKFDLFHIHSPFSLGRFAIKTAKKQGVPVVATLHTQYHLDFERTLKGITPLVKFMTSYVTRAYKLADRVWTVSDKACEVLRSYGYKGKIDVVRNGTSFTYPDNAEQLVEEVNQKHDLKDQKNVFLFVGRMAWYKGLKIIIDALKLVKQQAEDFKMIFVGGGFDLSDVKKYAEKLGLKNECIFTGEIKDKNLLQGYYLRSDLFLFPSTFDTSSVVKVEAAAHNLASVLVKDSCAAELVEDGVNGFLAEASAESYAEKLLEIIKYPGRMTEVGKEAGKTLYRSWETVAEEVVQKYHEIIEEHNRRKRIILRAFSIHKYKRKMFRLEKNAKHLISKLKKYNDRLKKEERKKEA